MDCETIIGLEVHAQLLTKSKMFCSCSADYANAPPNTLVCPICLGMPGVLPTINRKAIEYTMMTALALNCLISEHVKFDRKNYPYPDLMKGYQISQYDHPVGRNGSITIDVNGSKKTIGIMRVHLEEDVAKLFHRVTPWGESYSLIDVNRSGVPLMEIVSEPEINSPEEARQYLMKLRSILQYLGVSTGNMEEGSFRCDANISLRPKGSPQLLPKVEIKNMNSFKAVFQALQYEVHRQKQVLEQKGELTQETRGWVEERGLTVAQRSKEYAHDYRYFPEPDLPPIILDSAWIEEIKSRLPELPEVRRDRFISQYGLSVYDANLLTNSRAVADYFENCLELISSSAQASQLPTKAKEVSNWLLGEFSRLLNATNTKIQESRVTPRNLVDLLSLIEQDHLTGPAAKAVFEEMFHTGKPPSQIMAEKELSQLRDTKEIKKVINQVIADNTKAVSDFRSGKQPALTFLIGQVMRITKGRANPETVRELILTELGGKENA